MIIMMPTNAMFILVIQLLFTITTNAQLCQVPFLPALQIINMPENAKIGDRIANLSITGTPAEISTRLLYNNTGVRTNGTEYFSLSFTELSLRYTLDYEWWTANNYANPFRFVVQCTVLPNVSVVNIDFQLDLLDVNDNPPRFNQSIYRINITEATPINTIVSADIAAYDIDSPPFAAFTYFLPANSSTFASYFQLVSSTNASLVLVKPLVYNVSTASFNLTIVAQNTDNNSLSSNATISIFVIDVDNLNPKFNVSSYNLNISIDTRVGEEVTPNEGPVFAYDQDLGINAAILYSFLTTNIYFSINNTTGRLTLRNGFNSTMRFELVIKAEQVDNVNRTATAILYVNIFEINNFPPIFLNAPYTLIGYFDSESTRIPILNGTVSDSDPTPRLSYASLCNPSSLTLSIRKSSLRDFQIQPIFASPSSIFDTFVCLLNVSDGSFWSQSNLTVLLYQPASFSLNSSLFFIDYSSNTAPINIAIIRLEDDPRCPTQLSLDSSSNAFFSISQAGNLTWKNPAILPAQAAYEIQVIARQNCSSLIRSATTTIIVTYRNFPSSTSVTSSTRSSNIDSTTIYAIIASVGAFILIVIAILFIVLYYHIQRAKHRVPPFFKTPKSSSPKFLTFRKPKSLLGPSSPLDVRDDDSSNSTSSDQTTSSPLQNRLLSNRYKVSEPPINTTIEELLSSYDNRSTSSSSSSFVPPPPPPGQIPINNHPGAFRSPLRDHQLDTINEDRLWMSNDPRLFTGPRISVPPEDAMDIISESHESSFSGSAIETGTSPSTLVHHQPSSKRNASSRDGNEYLTVLV